MHIATHALSSGRVFMLVLALMLVETLVVVYFKRNSGSDVAAYVVNIMAGAGLLSAMVLMVGGAAPFWIGLALSAALIAHVEDLRRRWRS